MARYQENTAQEQWHKMCGEDSPSALKWLFEVFYDDLYAYSCKITSSKESSSDAIQNTFAELWLYRKNLTQPLSVKAYLFRSVRNHCIRLDKSKAVNLNIRDFAEQICFEPEEFRLKESVHMQKKKISDILNTCTPRQKEILFLRFYDNLNYHEIADILGIRYQSVVNHLHEAISHLRQHRELKELLFEI